MNESISSDEWPPSFSLDKERILNLLTGDRFYSNASAALREAVLNAIDAIHRRQNTETNLIPRIKVEFNRDNLTLSISDNGEGMDQTAVSRLFTRIGSSAATMQTGQGSVGEFGIGVVSYFMAGDTFSVQTYDGSSQSIGLRFSRTMFAGGTAEQLTPTQDTRGTTVEIKVRNDNIFSLLLDKFPYWCLDVSGLVGILQPGSNELNQGGIDRPISVSGLPKMEWIERAHLSPVSGPTGWDSMSGESVISVLYRGVFVQEFTVRGLWGIEGSIDVDPKHFQPRLNREGFVEGEFKAEVEQFLRQSHPTILQVMAERLSEFLSKGDLDKWTVKKWATLWLSIPRDQSYANAANEWDSIFRKIPAFELAVGNKWEPISFERLISLSEPIYVAPHLDEKQTDVVKAALRLLRHTGHSVIRGLQRDRNWLRFAGNTFGTTADLIASVFVNEVPAFTPLVQNAEKLLAELKPVVTLYSGTPSVDLVEIGDESPPVLRLQSRLILNIDHPQGKVIVNETLKENKGRWSLIAITARYSHEHLSQVAAAVRDSAEGHETLGLVKRRYIKGLLK